MKSSSFGLLGGQASSSILGLGKLGTSGRDPFALPPPPPPPPAVTNSGLGSFGTVGAAHPKAGSSERILGAGLPNSSLLGSSDLFESTGSRGGGGGGNSSAMDLHTNVKTPLG